MDFFKQRLQIKHLSFPRFISGPVDGILDAPFRQLIRDYSKDNLLYTEIRHVRSIITPQGGAKALAFAQLERPLNFQIAANDPEHIEQACVRIIQAGVDMIDLNVGCPARNVVASSSGSALMAQPEKLQKILLACRSAIPDHIPFTVKIRSGFKQVNALDIAKLAQDCGVDALAIHPRLQTQRFSGQPDLALVAAIKKSLQIPVLLSGNIINFKTALTAYQATGVDGFLIGRGMWAKPWKLEELQQHALGNEFIVTSDMLLHAALRHLDLMIQYYGNHGIYHFRKHLPLYIKGHPSASALRSTLVRSENFCEVQEGLKNFFTLGV